MTPEAAAQRLGDYRGWVRDTLSMVTLTVEASVKRVTPVRTGTLRRSITSRVEAAAERGVVGTNLAYARPVNARRRYMERGLQDAEPEIDRILAAQGAELFGRVE